MTDGTPSTSSTRLQASTSEGSSSTAAISSDSCGEFGSAASLLLPLLQDSVIERIGSSI